MTYYGKAAFWGVGTYSFSGVIVNQCDIQSLNYSRTGNIEYLTDCNGDDKGGAVYNTGHRMQVSITPTSGSRAAVNGNLIQMVPVLGTKVGIAHTDLPFLSGSFTGSYMVTEASLSLSNKGFATVDLTLEARDANDITATVS